jgi:hypothetical protein
MMHSVSDRVPPVRQKGCHTHLYLCFDQRDWTRDKLLHEALALAEEGARDFYTPSWLGFSELVGAFPRCEENHYLGRLRWFHTSVLYQSYFFGCKIGVAFVQCSSRLTIFGAL